MAVSKFWQNTATHAVVITKSDTVKIVDGNSVPIVTRSIYVGGTGNITCIMDKGQTVLFSSIPAGTILPIAASQVMSTGTTATLMVALY